MTEPRKLRVFLCHSSTDKPIVRDLYQRLLNEPWLDPWLDEENLLPGMDWDMEIEKAVEATDVVLVCVSNNSVTKEGYVQRELKFALDVALEKPEGTIFIVPLRLDDCNLPRRLRTWQYVDYFPASQHEKAYQRLLQSLKLQYKNKFSSDAVDEIINISKREDENNAENLLSQNVKKPNVSPIYPEKNKLFDFVGLSFVLSYFVVEFLVYLNDTSTFHEYLRLIFVAFSGLYFVIRKHVPAFAPFKIMALIYMFLYPLIYYMAYKDTVPTFSWTLLMITSLLTAGSTLTVLRSSKETVSYTSVSLGIFFFLVGAQIVAQLNSIYDTRIMILQFIATFATAVFMWKKL